jgi:hypothetical protein
MNIVDSSGNVIAGNSIFLSSPILIILIFHN